MYWVSCDAGVRSANKTTDPSSHRVYLARKEVTSAVAMYYVMLCMYIILLLLSAKGLEGAVPYRSISGGVSH